MPQFIFQYGEDWEQSLRKRPEAIVKEKEDEYPKVHTIDITGLKGIDAWNKIQSEIQKRDFEGLKKRVEELERKLR